MKKGFNRRQFLRSASGATLAIPFLPSLVKDAHAQEMTMPKFFVAFAYENGAVWGQNMYPDDSVLTSSMEYAGRTVRYGDLSGTVANGNRVLCPALTAPESLLGSSLVGKLNVLRGLDIPWYIAHHSGGYLGNMAANLSETETVIPPMRTIDQVMAYSDSFYPNTDGVIERSIAFGNGQKMSWNYASPTTRSGPLQPCMRYQDHQFLFDALFTPGERYRGVSNFIVDQVLERFNSVRQRSGISVRDKQKLEQHMEQVYEIQRKMQATLTCDANALPNGYMRPEEPNTNLLAYHYDFGVNPTLQGEFWKSFNDVLVVAFSCGLTQVATALIMDNFSTYGGHWHNEVAHGATLPEMQSYLVEANRNIFDLVFLDLASKLDAVEAADGQTLLDHSLLMWTQESGQVTHYSESLPVVTAGSAGGFFRTGQFVDYRNRDILYDRGDERFNEHPGLIWNQWMGTLLQSMGLDPSEYEDGINGGYGFHYVDDTRIADYLDAELVMGDPLPIIT